MRAALRFLDEKDFSTTLEIDEAVRYDDV